MNIKNRIKVSISNIPKAVKPIPGIQDSLITRSGRVFLKERGVWYEIIPKINKGRLRLTIRGKNWPLHRLLALAWIINPKPNEYNIVRHLDGYNKRSLSRILLLHPNTINRVLNKPQDYEY
jgi:hypothetical protein